MTIKCVIRSSEYDARLSDILVLSGGRQFVPFSILSSATDQVAVSLSLVACSMLLAHVLELEISATPHELGCARGTLLMWQRTYRQRPQLEGSKFESIRPNRMSTTYDYKAYALCTTSHRGILVIPNTSLHVTITWDMRCTTAAPYLQASEVGDSSIRVLSASFPYVNRYICIEHHSQVMNPNLCSTAELLGLP